MDQIGDNMENYTYHLAEKFVSINGEARFAGELAVFLRFTGCNLRCGYCDTKWAIEKDSPYVETSLEELVSYVRETGVDRVTLTGGEPLIQPHMRELIEALLQDGRKVEIETNGAVSIKKYLDIEDSLRLKPSTDSSLEDKNQESRSGQLTFTVDYKCPKSGMEDRMLMENFEAVRENDTVKFVVSDMADLVKMKEIVDRYDLTNRAVVYVSAVFGEIDPKDIVQFMMDNKMNKVKYQLQIHKFIWDPNQKGV